MVLNVNLLFQHSHISVFTATHKAGIEDLFSWSRETTRACDFFFSLTEDECVCSELYWSARTKMLTENRNKHSKQNNSSFKGKSIIPLPSFYSVLCVYIQARREKRGRTNE